MTQQELSLQECRFSTVIDTSEKNFPSIDQPSDVDLAACFHAFLQREYLLPPPEELKPVKTAEEHRRQTFMNPQGNRIILRYGMDISWFLVIKLLFEIDTMQEAMGNTQKRFR